MDKPHYKSALNLELVKDIRILKTLPLEVKRWVESLPFNQRRYV